MSRCEYCREPRDCESTRETKGQVWCCTRPAGHDGDHVACGTLEHAVKAWKPRIPREAKAQSLEDK